MGYQASVLLTELILAQICMKPHFDNFDFSGYNNVEEVIFETLQFETQMKIIQCTDLLIGVQGAGLQW